MKSTVSAAFCLLMLTFANPSYAVGLDIKGKVQLEIKDRNVSLYVENVCNYDETSKSGTLSLQVWATLEPYTGAAIDGEQIVLYQNIDTLEGGWCYPDMNRKEPYISPVAGDYYINVILAMWNGIEFVPYDWVSFPNIYALRTINDIITAETTARDDTPYSPPPPPETSDSGGGGCFINTLGPMGGLFR